MLCISSARTRVLPLAPTTLRSMISFGVSNPKSTQRVAFWEDPRLSSAIITSSRTPYQFPAATQTPPPSSRHAWIGTPGKQCLPTMTWMHWHKRYQILDDSAERRPASVSIDHWLAHPRLQVTRRVRLRISMQTMQEYVHSCRPVFHPAEMVKGERQR